MYLCYGHDISLFITLLIAINISSYRIVRNINLPRYKVVSLMILNSERIQVYEFAENKFHYLVCRTG